MDSLTTHPSNALQAKAFTAPSSLSMPGGAGDLTPPNEANGASQSNGAVNGQNVKGVHVNGQANGVAPSTPAATPGAAATVGTSGIVPTLQ